MRAIAAARLAVVVDLPTPPFPDATAMMFFTPLMVVTPGWTLCVPISVSMDRWMCVSPVSGIRISCMRSAVSEAMCATGKPKCRAIWMPSERCSTERTAFSLPSVRAVFGTATVSRRVRMFCMFIMCVSVCSLGNGRKVYIDFGRFAFPCANFYTVCGGL